MSDDQAHLAIDACESERAKTIAYLYRSLLKREAGPDEIGNCIAWMRSGRSIDELHDLIIRSDEYRSRLDDHPLAHLPDIYRTKYLSFFTHRGRYRPLGLSIETVNICNNDCIICPYSSQTRARQAMSMTMFSRIVSDYATIGGGPVTLTPMVGEVFLDKRLLERLQILRASPAITEVSTITNASMVRLYSDDELVEIISLFDRITVSIYGLDAEEFQLMTRKNGYDEFLVGLTRLLRLAGPGKVKLGARHLKKRTEAEIENWLGDLAASACVSREEIHFAGTSTYANWGFFDTSIPLPFDATWSSAKVNSEQCALPLISMQILSDGTVSFCGCANFDGVSELTIGHIEQQSLAQILSGDQVRRLWDWSTCGTPDFCKSCSFHAPIGILSDLPGAFADPYGTFGG